MTPSDLNMILSVKQGVPSITLSDRSLHTVTGYIDWMAIVMSWEKSCVYPCVIWMLILNSLQSGSCRNLSCKNWNQTILHCSFQKPKAPTNSSETMCHRLSVRCMGAQGLQGKCMDSHASAPFIITQENYDSQGFDEWTWLDIPDPHTQQEGRQHVPPILRNPCLLDWRPKFDGRTLKRCSLHNLFDYHILGMMSLCMLSRSTADSPYTGIRWFIVTKILMPMTITLCMIRVCNVLILCSRLVL